MTTVSQVTSVNSFELTFCNVHGLVHTFVRLFCSWKRKQSFNELHQIVTNQNANMVHHYSSFEHCNFDLVGFVSRLTMITHISSVISDVTNGFACRFQMRFVYRSIVKFDFFVHFFDCSLEFQQDNKSLKQIWTKTHVNIGLCPFCKRMRRRRMRRRRMTRRRKKHRDCSHDLTRFQRASRFFSDIHVVCFVKSQNCIVSVCIVKRRNGTDCFQTRHCVWLRFLCF